MADRINALIVEDEIGAVRTLKGMLTAYFPIIAIVESAQTVAEAVKMANLYKPDLVFLDVEMPPFGSGFDFLEQCKELNFGVIFTTAYPKYAIQAINNIQPWSYLVKPYSVEHLGSAIQIAEDKINELKATLNPNIPTTSLIVPDSRKGKIVIPKADILFCKADGSSTCIYYIKNDQVLSVIASSTLKAIEEKLHENAFCRCHHSYIVNLCTIDHFQNIGRGGIIYLIKKIEVPISISRREHFWERFKQIHG